MKKVWYIVLLTWAIVLVVYGVMEANDKKHMVNEEENPSVEVSGTLNEGSNSLLVTMINTKGETVGEAKLEQTNKGVNIQLNASNLTPGVHGFHIHENGVCEAPSFESAGGHFNPTGAKHGFDHPEGPHAGDLPNIEVKQDGTVSTNVLAEMVTLEKGKDNSLLKEGGTSLMIHSKADDYKSQPAGDSGERIACGVIAE
ncbi:superoxide dismutase family protein [Ornithinibacillus halotolerans]|uniref:Superoxide dismutase [Cu-Zn] n=1 Tax=Ornithinibacillus halotolerans TaxID=1274357 RepID=A0A916S3J9_9BACI|nr:superoxide dismutase family protein [Ornithinibacillus halotolerans]GGA82705.1 hypothetical protein GCM10008025_27320 [Ornithinibacillus halotolerans]